jgi:hypothetical protein
VLLNPPDPAQLGSTLRTAWSLGWDRVSRADGNHVWYARDRATFALSRGAARRHRNPIRVVPFDAVRPPAAITVVTLGGPGPALRHDPCLAEAATIVVPDERDPAAHETAAALASTGSTVRWATLGVPVVSAPYDYRVVTAVALAEIARRIGWQGARRRDR